MELENWNVKSYGFLQQRFEAIGGLGHNLKLVLYLQSLVLNRNLMLT